MIIDAHQHFWKFDPIRDAWIDNTMQEIRRDFLPSDLLPILSDNKIDGCVAVQADQSEAETNYLLNLAAQNNFVKGVVGWVDLLADDLEERLTYFSQDPYFKGVRHIAQGEADDFLARDEVRQGISKLESFGLTYDILVFAHQLPAAIDLVSQLPNQKFVLDHIAKPKISEGLDNKWRVNIASLATNPNVHCKVSGMVTETKSYQWNQSDFRPFLDVVLHEFGTSRVMYGSDWPVCLLAAEYEEQLAIVQEYINTLSSAEQKMIMGDNATLFYNLTRREVL